MRRAAMAVLAKGERDAVHRVKGGCGRETRRAKGGRQTRDDKTSANGRSRFGVLDGNAGGPQGLESASVAGVAE